MQATKIISSVHLNLLKQDPNNMHVEDNLSMSIYKRYCTFLEFSYKLLEYT